MGVSLKLIIDRVRITGIHLTAEQYHIAREQLPEIAKLQKGLLTGTSKIKYSKSKYVFSINLSIGKHEPVARLEVGSTCKLHYYLAWELWPHRCKGKVFQEFHELVQLLLDSKVYWYHWAFEHGRVQYIELASDSITRKHLTFVPWTKYARLSWIYEDAMGKGSIYVGGQTSPQRFSCYDKARHLKSLDLPCPHSIQTRFEVRVRKTGLSPKNLIQLKNPFKSLEVADLQKARAASTGKQFHHFLDLCEEFGSGVAFDHLTKKERSETRAILLGNTMTGWNPSLIWKGYSAALENIHPEFLHA